MKQKTAILIFANSSEEERKLKPIAKGGRLFDELNEATLRTVQKTKLPYFHFTEKEQTGTNFGERFVNAIQTVYDKGFENVVTLGNDSPQLSKKHLLKAAAELEKNKFVLGPSKDGGFYLMGLAKEIFDPSLFLKLPWQKSHLRRRISNLIASQKIEIINLEILVDIDKVSDIKRLVDGFSTLPLKLEKLLRRILFSAKKIFRPQLIFSSSFLHKIPFNKGSPLIAS